VLVMLKKMVLETALQLDRLSAQVRRYTFHFESIVTVPTNDQSWRTTFHYALVIEATLVFIWLAFLSTASRMLQYQAMSENLNAYFLPGLLNVSTTNDSGFYMSMATSWVARIESGSTLTDIKPGELFGFCLAWLSTITDVSMEQTARYFLYASTSITAFSLYLLLATLGQSSLGLASASALIFFFPVYGRTSLGMLDTDLLNLFFFISIPIFIVASVRSKILSKATIHALLAGLLCFLFYFWYNRPGFMIPLIGLFLTLSIVYGARKRNTLVTLITFALASGVDQIRYSINSLESLLRVYAQPLVGSIEVEGVARGGSEVKTLLLQTVSEIAPVSMGVIQNDFGSLVVFGMCIAGVLLWGLQDWRRVPLIIYFATFLILYFISGQRFIFFASPILLVGFFTIISSVVVIVRFIKPPHRKDKQEGASSRLDRSSQVGIDNVAVGQSGVSFKPRNLFISLAMFVVGWPAQIFPPSDTIPPPVLPAYEITALRHSLTSATREPPFVASIWDLGHEIRYQTGMEVLSDGLSPGSLKNVYVARALIAMDPYVAADELRFAAYFTETDLEASYPRRPNLELSRGTSRDIYLFLPHSLQYKMYTTYQVAEKTMSKDATRLYNPQMSTFYILYHKQPQKWGPFELLLTQVNGATIYRLPAPNVSK